VLPAPAVGPLATSLSAAPSPRGLRLWGEQQAPALTSIAALKRAGRYTDAWYLQRIAGQPHALWVSGDVGPAVITQRLRLRMAHARASAGVPVVVLYAIPHRDCGGHSGGGAATAAGYRSIVNAVATGVGTTRAIVVVEPDALAHLSCLGALARTQRYQLLNYAVRRLSASGTTFVYLDAGHAGWVAPRVMAGRLRLAGVARARGISLNVAAFNRTAVEIGFARALATALARPLPVVIDTGRNGLGAATGPLRWCNPAGRALGSPPTTTHPVAQVDALLWIKSPGQSDGACRPGEPRAGAWWHWYAIGLSRRANW
jgi:endoglucanase